MKFLLTSAGVSNPSINRALVEVLGKPISEASALFVPTAIYPFSGGSLWRIKPSPARQGTHSATWAGNR